MKKYWKSFLKYFLRVLAVLGVTLGLLIVGLYFAIFIVARGPSPSAGKLFVRSVKETSAGGFLADMFYSQDEIAEIVKVTASDLEKEATDTSLIKIRKKGGTDSTDTPDDTDVYPTDDPAETTGEEEYDPTDGIEIYDVVGATYKGKMMVIDDPSRVFIGIPPAGYGAGKYGMSVYNMVKHYGAIAGINGGGFYDPDGMGTGGIPEGYVIYEGNLVWDTYCTGSIVGFDKDHILHVGLVSPEYAKTLGMQYAVCFGPALIVNGIPANSDHSLGGGVNPRTCVGQRADGAVLFLVINGRQVDSIGATFDDCVDIMMKYGAVNASNLDGGSSSMMIYNDEYMISSAYLFGERIVPNAILVK